MNKPKISSGIGVAALTGGLFLFVLSGCKSPPPAEEATVPDAPQEAAVSEVVMEAPVEKSAVSESQTKPGKGVRKAKKAEADIAANKGPGDGPPPSAETKRKVEEMEQSLAPLQAVPATPPS